MLGIGLFGVVCIVASYVFGYLRARRVAEREKAAAALAGEPLLPEMQDLLRGALGGNATVIKNCGTYYVGRPGGPWISIPCSELDRLIRVHRNF